MKCWMERVLLFKQWTWRKEVVDDKNRSSEIQRDSLSSVSSAAWQFQRGRINDKSSADCCDIQSTIRDWTPMWLKWLLAIGK